MTDTTTAAIFPRAKAVDGGVDLLLPPETPFDALQAFVASCNLGGCDCADTFVGRIQNVELFAESDQLRVHITGDTTPEEVLSEMANSAARDLA